jgi:hypothetical protein
MDAFTVQKPWMTWTGRVFSFIVVGMLLFSAYVKVSGHPEAVGGFAKAGYPDGVVFTIGIVEILCALLYAIPKTRYFGAVLVAGYLGGAICHHVRADEAFTAPLVLGILAWVGLWLRDASFRRLAPLSQD